MKTLVYAAVALATATPALAQEAPAAGGARIEARLGWDRPVVNLEATSNGDSLQEDAGKSGIVYGVEAGYDFNFHSSIVGLYAGIEDSSVKECAEVFGGDETCLKAGRNITVGARVGFDVGNRGIVYAKGGYSNGRASLTYADPAAPSDNFRLSDNLDGFHLGAGGEFPLGPNVYGKLEYVYTNYSGYGYDDGVDSLELSSDRHQIVAGVGFRF